MRSLLPLAVVLLVAVSAGCAEKQPAPETPEIAVLKRDLARELRSTVPEVEMEDSAQLEITFYDSGLVRLSRNDKDAAWKVMEYVRDNYPPYERLTAVTVGFAPRYGVGRSGSVVNGAIPATRTRSTIPPGDRGRPRTCGGGERIAAAGVV